MNVLCRPATCLATGVALRCRYLDLERRLAASPREPVEELACGEGRLGAVSSAKLVGDEPARPSGKRLAGIGRLAEHELLEGLERIAVSGGVIDPPLQQLEDVGGHARGH